MYTYTTRKNHNHYYRQVAIFLWKLEVARRCERKREKCRRKRKFADVPAGQVEWKNRRRSRSGKPKLISIWNKYIKFNASGGKILTMDMRGQRPIYGGPNNLNFLTKYKKRLLSLSCTVIKFVSKYVRDRRRRRKRERTTKIYVKADPNDELSWFVHLSELKPVGQVFTIFQSHLERIEDPNTPTL